MLWTRLALPGALALCAISACGGNAFTSDSDATGGAPGGSSAGGSDSGGAPASGGKATTSGGKASGGTMTTGGVSASGGVTASGGASSTGGTKATGGASSTGGAKATGGVSSTGGTTATGGAVARGGSSGSAGTGGLKNAGGSAGQASFDACTASSQCTLVAASCCGACEPSELSNFVAINSARNAEYTLSRPCTNVLCAPCPAPTPETTQSGNFGARCVSGHCQAFDVRTTELSACEDSSDCRLRVGMSCCEGCSGGLAAVSKNADLQQALCGDSSGPGGQVACLACAPILPSNASPSCAANGHCAVTWTNAGTD